MKDCRGGPPPLDNPPECSAPGRLSTSNRQVDREKLLVDIEELKKPSNYEIIKGRTFIKSLNRYLNDIKPIPVLILEVSTGNIIKSFKSYNSCAKFLGLHDNTVRRWVKSDLQFSFEGKLVCIQKGE